MTTVDKFQGQQNDFILLSLVRSKTVGHLRDVRRLVVGVYRRSAIRLVRLRRPLVVLGVFELAPAFETLAEYPTALELCVDESRRVRARDERSRREDGRRKQSRHGRARQPSSRREMAERSNGEKVDFLRSHHHLLKIYTHASRHTRATTHAPQNYPRRDP